MFDIKTKMMTTTTLKMEMTGHTHVQRRFTLQSESYRKNLSRAPTPNVKHVYQVSFHSTNFVTDHVINHPLDVPYITPSDSPGYKTLKIFRKEFFVQHNERQSKQNGTLIKPHTCMLFNTISQFPLLKPAVIDTW